MQQKLGAGLTYAAYAAWLGSAASYVTIGLSVGTILPPLLIGGALVGLVGGIVKGKKSRNEKQKLKKDLMDTMKDIRREKMLKEVIPKIVNKIRDRSDEIANNTHSEFVSGIAENWSEKEIDNLNSKIDNYCNRIKTLKKKDIKINI